MTAAPRAGTVAKGGKARGAAKPAATVKPTQTPGSRIKAPKIGSVSRTRLSGQKMNEGAGKRGKARQQRQQSMAVQRQMIKQAPERQRQMIAQVAAKNRLLRGRIKPGKSAEPLSTGGTLAARASLKRAKAKAVPGASPAQRGAVKRAGTYLKASKERNRATLKGPAPRGTVAKPKGLKQGALATRSSTKTMATNQPPATRLPAAQRPGSLTSTLRNTLRTLAKADAANIRELEAITGSKIRPTPAGARAGAEAGARVRGTAKGGKVAATLRAGLRELAQSDARRMREMAGIIRDATPKVAGSKGAKALRGSKPALPAAGKRRSKK